MNSVLDEIRVADDGSLDIRIIENDSTSSLPYRLVTLEPGDPATELIRDGALHKIARILGTTSPIRTIVHDGEDRFTVISADGVAREINEKEWPQAVSGIREIADLAAMSISPRRNVLSQCDVIPRSFMFIEVILNHTTTFTGGRFSTVCPGGPAEEFEPWFGVFNRVSRMGKAGMPAYEEPNRLPVRSKQ
jgi:hypothetical protein